MTSKVHLVCTWWCMDCTERGDPAMSQDDANKAADKHVRETGHPTVTNMRPAR